MDNPENDILRIRLLFSEALDILNIAEEGDCNVDLEPVKQKIDEAESIKKVMAQKYPEDVFNKHIAEVSQVAKLIQNKTDNIITKIRLDMDATSSELEKMKNLKKLALYKR